MITLAARIHRVDEVGPCLESGFDHLEISLPCPGGPEEEEYWLALARDKKVSLLGHGPHEGNPRDLLHLEKNYLPRLKEAAAAARRLGCLKLTIHFWLESRWLSRETIDCKILLLSKVVAWGRADGIPINLENLSEQWADLKPALDRNPDLGLTLDVGHAQIMQTENASPDIIEHHFPRISHLHLHDNHGGVSPKDDLHLPPGEGIVPFKTIFSALKQRGYASTATLELKPHQLPGAKAWVEDVWQSVLGNED